MSRTYHRRMRVTRTFCSVLCWFCAACSSGRAVGARPEEVTVAARAQAAAGRGRDRARGRRRAPRHLRRRSRAREAADRRAQGPARRRRHRPGGHGGAQAVHASPAAGLFLTLQRNVEWWTTQRLLNAASGSASPAPSSSTSSIPATASRSSGSARSASSTATGAAASATTRAPARSWTRSRRWPPSAPAASRGSTCSRSTARQPPWVSSLAQGTGLQAMARSATRLNRQEDVFPVALAGLGIFQTAPPAGVRVPSGTGAHYLQYSGLPNFKVVNGFIQSLVGLYDFAALTGDPTAPSLFDDGDRAGRAEIGTFDTGAWWLYSRGVDHARVRPRLPQAPARLPQGAVRPHDGDRVLRAEQHFTTYLATPPVGAGAAAHADRAQAGQHPLQALEDLARRRCTITRGGSPWPRSTPVSSAAAPRRSSGPRPEVRRLRRDASPPPTSTATPPPRPV